MARSVILRVREGDPACDRAREFVARIAAELGLELDVRRVDSSPGDLLPQVSLWDGTWLDRVADEGALRDAIAAKLRSEEDAAESNASEHDARLAREKTERERFAKVRSRRKAQATPRNDEPPSRDEHPEPLERERGPVGPAPQPRPPVLLRGGRRGRWDVAARLARKVRSGGIPLVFVAVFFVAFLVFGRREAPEGEPAPGGEVPAVEAPRLDLPTLDGFRFDLGRERGRAVLVVLFDARKPDRNALAALAAEAEKVTEVSPRDARVLAVGVGLGIAELRAAVGDVPFALTIAADADGRATGAFAESAGPGAGWWLVDPTGRVVARGPRLGPEAFRILLATARGAGAGR